MLFMVFMIPKGYRDAPADFRPDSAQLVPMGKFNDSMRQAGVLKSVNGLKPPSTGERLAFGAGDPAVSHGPFSQTSETVGGYWLLDVASQQEAVDWMKKCPAMPGDVIEIRQVEA